MAEELENIQRMYFNALYREMKRESLLDARKKDAMGFKDLIFSFLV